MKLLTIIFCLFTTLSASAQVKDSAQLVLVDGEIYKGDVNKIDQKNIINIKVIQNGSDETVITTRPYAIKLYREKLSALCPKYKSYLEKKHDDSNLAYVIDNRILDLQVRRDMEDLYELTPGKIAKVEFKKDRHFTTDATVIITTKE